MRKKEGSVSIYCHRASFRIVHAYTWVANVSCWIKSIARSKDNPHDSSFTCASHAERVDILAITIVQIVYHRYPRFRTRGSNSQEIESHLWPTGATRLLTLTLLARVSMPWIISDLVKATTVCTRNRDRNYILSRLTSNRAARLLCLEEIQRLR